MYGSKLNFSMVNSAEIVLENCRVERRLRRSVPCTVQGIYNYKLLLFIFFFFCFIFLLSPENTIFLVIIIIIIERSIP